MKANIPKNPGGNMQAMLQQAQKMQEEMAEKQAELEAEVYDISAYSNSTSMSPSSKE